jgi:GST-like protein
MYLAEKFGAFLPTEPVARAECLSWLFWQMGSAPYLGGDEYTIADIATFPWYGGLVKGKLYDAAEFLDVTSYRHVVRWASEIAERDAVRRGERVNKAWGPEELRVPERHAASDLG